VPYKGTGPNLIDLVAGRSISPPPARRRPRRTPASCAWSRWALQSAWRFADVGTVAEQGFPGFEASQWYGLNAPAKPPLAIVKRLSRRSGKGGEERGGDPTLQRR
jgi:hypothetical protein